MRSGLVSLHYFISMGLTEWTCSLVVDFVESVSHLFAMRADSNAFASITKSPNS